MSQIETLILEIMRDRHAEGCSAAEMATELRERGALPELWTVIDVADEMKRVLGPRGFVRVNP